MSANLDHAIDKLANLDITYRIADDEGRRHINQGFFERLFVVDEGITGDDLAWPYLQILDDDLAGRISAEQRLPPEELFKTDDQPGIMYEARDTSPGDATARDLLSQIDWHPYERHYGALPVDMKNPAAYERRRGSNLTLLAGCVDGAAKPVTMRFARVRRIGLHQ